MKLKYYQIDGFTHEVFKGNPGGVCPLDEWLDDTLMQQIATEINLSETCFFVRKDEYFELRWFTPTVEVDLCGHGTLISGYTVFNYQDWKNDTVMFKTISGMLSVTKNNDIYMLDFPVTKISESRAPDGLIEGLGMEPVDVYEGRDYIAVFEKEKDILNLKPDFEILKQIDTFGVVATAKGNNVDFVSRFFCPQVGINEDPATGSTHTELIPYWSERLGKEELIAHQLSRRGGEFYCFNRGERVGIGGKAVTFLTGHIEI